VPGCRRSEASASGQPSMSQCAPWRIPMHFLRRILGSSRRWVTRSKDQKNWNSVRSHGGHGDRTRHYCYGAPCRAPEV